MPAANDEGKPVNYWGKGGKQIFTVQLCITILGSVQLLFRIKKKFFFTYNVYISNGCKSCIHWRIC
jgi:hypothetical protein